MVAGEVGAGLDANRGEAVDGDERGRSMVVPNPACRPRESVYAGRECQ